MLNGESHKMDGTDLTSEDERVMCKIDKLNTKKCTQWTLTTWKVWRAAINSEAGEEVVPSLYSLMSVAEEVMDTHLERFVKDLKNSGGGEYPFDSVKNIVFGIQRYAKAYSLINKSPVRMLTGNFVPYPKFNKAMDDKQKMLRKKGIGNKANKKQALGISPAQEAALWDNNIFGCHSANALSDTVFFYVAKIFGFVSGTSLRLISKEHFTFGENEYGKYMELDISFTQESNTKDIIYNRCHGIEVPETSRLRHYCNPSNPRSFYNILQIYLEALKNVIPENNHPFSKDLFMMPNQGTCMKFTPNPLGKNALQRKFSKIMHYAGFAGEFTNQAMVMSVPPLLQAKGYNVRQRRFFQSVDHLEICKILDPPLGPLPNSYNDIECDPSTALQLVSLPTPSLNQSTSLVASGGYALQGQQPNTIIQGQQPSTFIQKFQLVSIPMQTFGNIQQNGQQSFYLQQTAVPPPTERTIAPKAKLPLPKSPKAAKKKQSICSDIAVRNDDKHLSLSSSKDSTSSGTMYNLRKILNSRTLAETQDSVTETAGSGHPDIKIEPLPENILPLFLRKAGESSSQSNDTQPEIVIKCEPVDEVDEYGIRDIVSGVSSFNSAETDNKHVPDIEENNESIPEDGKRKCAEETDESQSSSKKTRLEEEENRQDVETNSTEVHTAQIEYSFSNDLKRNSVKQEVSVNDDNETLFSFSATNKMGKTLNDLDLNLGDFLPDDCLLKPGNINLKRVVTPEGGKLILQVTYKT